MNAQTKGNEPQYCENCGTELNQKSAELNENQEMNYVRECILKYYE
jgi:hypothetical protein